MRNYLTVKCNPRGQAHLTYGWGRQPCLCQKFPSVASHEKKTAWIHKRYDQLYHDGHSSVVFKPALDQRHVDSTTGRAWRRLGDYHLVFHYPVRGAPAIVSSHPSRHPLLLGLTTFQIPFKDNER